MRVLSTAATGMQAQQLNVEVISNNIANMQTTGFKKSRAEFQDLLYQAIKREGGQTSQAGTIAPVGIQVGLGVKPAAISRVHTQGSLVNTDNNLDLAIDGRGYFAITLPSGETAYTRSGSFQLSPEGTIVTTDGYEVQPGITVPENTVDIQINAQGEVLAFLEGQQNPDQVGQLTMVTFVNDNGLSPQGDSLFLATPASGDPIEGVPGDEGFGIIRQGYIEASNVNIVQEITSLIAAQRAYEMNSKAVETGDQMSQTVSNMR